MSSKDVVILPATTRYEVADEKCTADCAGCGIDTAPFDPVYEIPTGPWEWYMVHRSLWEAAGMTTGYLCIGCLENRIGRELWGGDFTTAPINDIDPALDTIRLTDRKRRGMGWTLKT